MFYAAHRNTERVESLIVIGVNGAFNNVPDAMGTVKSLCRIQLPLLDIYGGNDLQGVKNTAVSRKQAAQLNNRQYQQTEVAGADHFFEGMEAGLLELVIAWLKINHASNE